LFSYCFKPSESAPNRTFIGLKYKLSESSPEKISPYLRKNFKEDDERPTEKRPVIKF